MAEQEYSLRPELTQRGKLRKRLELGQIFRTVSNGGIFIHIFEGRKKPTIFVFLRVPRRCPHNSGGQRAASVRWAGYHLDCARSGPFRGNKMRRRRASHLRHGAWKR